MKNLLIALGVFIVLALLFFKGKKKGVANSGNDGFTGHSSVTDKSPAVDVSLGGTGLSVVTPDDASVGHSQYSNPAGVTDTQVVMSIIESMPVKGRLHAALLAASKPLPIYDDGVVVHSMLVNGEDGKHYLNEVALSMPPKRKLVPSSFEGEIVSDGVSYWQINNGIRFPLSGSSVDMAGSCALVNKLVRTWPVSFQS